MTKIDDKEVQEYLKELMTPYKKKGKVDCFIFQFLNGDGNELADKFWHINSSSRLAFDLYKWMSNDEKYTDIQFEYHLPGPASGGKGPNMDVFVETEDSIYFIESKFTEKPSAWVLFTDDDNKDSRYLSKAYFSKDVYGRNKMSLSQRFRNYPFAEDFSNFCIGLNEELKKKEIYKTEWFDVKQETCHLFGVLSFIYDLDNRELVKGKRILLKNVVWNNDGCTNVLAELFKAKANQLLRRYGQGLCESINFDYCFIQDVLKDDSLFNFPEKTRDEILKRGELITRCE